MNSSPKKKVLIAIGILLAVALGVWWYFGFTLEFSKFFAAIPEATKAPPAGCYYESLECIRAPCPDAGIHLVCPDGTPVPEKTCLPRPACLDAVPRCMIAEPSGGWCLPVDLRGTVSCTPENQTVTAGTVATVQAGGGDGVYTWIFPQGTMTFNFNDSIGVQYDTAGIKKVTVQSGRADKNRYNTYLDSVACTIEVIPFR